MQDEGGALLADTLGAGRDDSALAALVLETYEKLQSHAYPAVWLEKNRAVWENCGGDFNETPYAAEENTVAAKMDNQIDEEVKQRRADHIMELQAEISAEKEAEKVGKTYECICDGVDDETGMYLLRSAADCPEIDGSIMTPADTPLEAGAFYNVTITDADTYDLYGYAESKVEE